MIEDVAALARGIDGAIAAPTGHLPHTPPAARQAVEYLLTQRHYPAIDLDFAGAVEVAGVLIITSGDDPWTVGTPIALPNGRVVTPADAWQQMHMHNLDWIAVLRPDATLDEMILR